MAQAKYARDPHHLLRGELTRRWDQFTESEIDECCTDQSKLINLLQTRYGYVKSRAEKEIDLFFDEFHDRLRMAA
ncbi:MAG TPA: CsbD family protein [Terriglobia bacterium]|nr:CsbD family protein [Terriglobia bacterium]